jgi:hypothetical protein
MGEGGAVFGCGSRDGLVAVYDVRGTRTHACTTFASVFTLQHSVHLLATCLLLPMFYCGEPYCSFWPLPKVATQIRFGHS